MKLWASVEAVPPCYSFISLARSAMGNLPKSEPRLLKSETDETFSREPRFVVGYCFFALRSEQHGRHRILTFPLTAEKLRQRTVKGISGRNAALIPRPP